MAKLPHIKRNPSRLKWLRKRRTEAIRTAEREYGAEQEDAAQPRSLERTPKEEKP